MAKKQHLKPVDILLKIYIKRLIELEIKNNETTYFEHLKEESAKDEIIKLLEKEMRDPMTRYRAKKRINGIFEIIDKENERENKAKKYLENKKK